MSNWISSRKERNQKKYWKLVTLDQKRFQVSSCRIWSPNNMFLGHSPRFYFWGKLNKAEKHKSVQSRELPILPCRDGHIICTQTLFWPFQPFSCNTMFLNAWLVLTGALGRRRTKYIYFFKRWEQCSPGNLQ